MPIDTTRPTMYQTQTPFVEFYIGGYDILRLGGKPRRLVSFQHNIVGRGGGPWSIEVFDPDYVAIEELIFDLRDRTGPFEDTQITAPVLFRYGIVSQDGKVLSAPDSGEKFFMGSLDSFVPNYQPNGTMYTIEGYTYWTAKWDWSTDKRTFYDATIYDIVKRVCDFQGWIFKPLGEDEDAEDLPEGKRPVPLLDTQQSVDDTEERVKKFQVQDNEGPFKFVQRLCGEARSTDPKYQGYTCRLEYRADGQESEGGQISALDPQGYLYFGPKDVLKAPKRSYIYLRDPKSDIISFSPAILATMAISTGAAGGYVKGEDALRGEMAFHGYNEVDRMLKYFGNRRMRSGRTLSDLGQTQEGEPEVPVETPRFEGGTTGPVQLAYSVKPDPDANWVELTSAVNNRHFSDQQYMNVWLGAQMFATGATLEVVGDPYLLPNDLVAVYMFFPAENDEFRIHWTSGIWEIMAVSHNISSGTYTTTLELLRNGTPGDDGVVTQALYNTLVDTLDAEALERLGG